MSQDMKGSQMSIVIITKSCQIEIIKATNTAYTIEDKIINYTIKEFNQEERILIGIVFKTPDKEFVEVVRITYKYMVREIIYIIFNSLLGCLTHLEQCRASNLR